MKQFLFAVVTSAVLLGPTVVMAQSGVPLVGGDQDLAALIQDSQAPTLCDPTVGDVCLGNDGDVEDIVVTGSRIVSTSITNNQEGGVDEGGLVKLHGDLLVILRRGRLFTIDTSGGRLRPIDRINAYPPGVEPAYDWYDEMLVSDDRVVVIGYSYERGGTEINRFKLDDSGHLTFEDSHHITSNDYYSSRNYASRLVGRQLILYSPLGLRGGRGPMELAPTLSRWLGEGRKSDQRPLLSAEDVHVSPALRDQEDIKTIQALHSVIRCDLDSPGLACRATAVLGPSSRSFYVSSTAVYLWLIEHRWWPRGSSTTLPASALYRIPLNDDPPSAIRTRGAPIDQFSFREDAEVGVIDVMVVSEGQGDAMWRPEFAEGGVALLRLPLSQLGDGASWAPDSDYRLLPSLVEEGGRAVNRFVGDYLLYANTVWPDEGDEETSSVLNIVPLNGETVSSFTLPGEIGRIEQMGRDALAVSGDDALTFSVFGLSRGTPQMTDRFAMPAAAEAETRSHAFFYNPDPGSVDGQAGVLGLPVIRELEEQRGVRPLFYETADMAFLRRTNERLSSLGLLVSRPAGVKDDGCVASCVDWYGDARPIFINDRVLALLGYELVEGRIRGGVIHERRRVSFAPPAMPSRR